MKTDVRKSSAKERKTIAARVLSLASVLLAVATGVASVPPFVGVLLIGLVVALAWFALILFEWLPFLGRKYIHYPGYVIILLVFLPWAIYVALNNPDANQESATSPQVTTTVQDSLESNILTIGAANNVTVNQSAGHESTGSDEVDKMSIELQGGTVCDDCETRFAKIPSLAGSEKTVITTRWPVIISNNGLTTLSVTGYGAVSRVYGRRRNIETRLLDKKGLPTSLPINVKGGESIKLFLVVPIHVIDLVYDLVRDAPEFSGSFTPQELDVYLEKNHRMDLYGNQYRYATKAAGAGMNRVPAHVFSYSDDGTLADGGMQADQLTVEFKTARGDYFRARAVYYDGPQFRSPRVMPPLPRGKTATIQFELEGIDSLPKTE